MTLTLTRAGTRTPGQLGRPVLYWPHASGLCNLGVFPHVSGTAYTNAKVAVFVHGENFGCKPGWGSMTFEGALASGHLANLAQALHAAGWIVVTIDYPTCSTNKSRVSDDQNLGEFRIYGSWEEVHPIAVWPEQPKYVAQAIQFIKSNWSGVTGPTETLHGRDLWGSECSIDPSKVIVVGDKWGATLAMYALLQPTGYFGFERRLANENMDWYVPRDSHRVAAMILRDPGPLDFTQFYVEPSWDENGQPDELSGDIFGIMGRGESQRRWGSGSYSTAQPQGGSIEGDRMYAPVHPQWKRQSPWWILKENHLENLGLPMHVEVTGTGYDAKDGSLASGDWNPGFPRNDTANDKCWQQPHDGRIQGPALRDALENYLGATGTGSRIQMSEVRDPVTSAWPLLAAGSYASNVMAWLARFGL